MKRATNAFCYCIVIQFGSFSMFTHPTMFQESFWVHPRGVQVPASEDRWRDDDVPQQGPVLPDHPQGGRQQRHPAAHHQSPSKKWRWKNTPETSKSEVFIDSNHTLSIKESLCVCVCVLFVDRVWWWWCSERRSAEMISWNTGSTGTPDSTLPNRGVWTSVRSL